MTTKGILKEIDNLQEEQTAVAQPKGTLLDFLRVSLTISKQSERLTARRSILQITTWNLRKWTLNAKSKG